MSATGLVVYGGWQVFGIGDFSPFCLKLKTYLRMIGIPYKSRLGDPRKAPAKKIPYIDDDGTLVADSAVIIDYLKKKHHEPLDNKLTAEQHALGHVLRRTLEESLYWSLVYTRWLEDENWPEVRKLLVPVLPPVIGGLLADGPIRGGMEKQTYAQGTGRHSRDQVHALGCADIDATAVLFGDNPYLFGDFPSSYDAMAYGFLANALAFPKESPIAVRAKSKPNLVAFVDRVTTKYWATPDP